jgi:chaperonin GroES
MKIKVAKQNITPLEDNIVIRRMVFDKPVSDGGILIPQSAMREIPQQAEVIAVGPGRWLQNGSQVKSALKVGDVVILGKFGGSDVVVDGEVVTVIRESDIVAKIG